MAVVERTPAGVLTSRLLRCRILREEGPKGAVRHRQRFLPCLRKGGGIHLIDAAQEFPREVSDSQIRWLTLLFVQKSDEVVQGCGPPDVRALPLRRN